MRVVRVLRDLSAPAVIAPAGCGAGTDDEASPTPDGVGRSSEPTSSGTIDHDQFDDLIDRATERLLERFGDPSERES